MKQPRKQGHKSRTVWKCDTVTGKVPNRTLNLLSVPSDADSLNWDGFMPGHWSCLKQPHSARPPQFGTTYSEYYIYLMDQSILAMLPPEVVCWWQFFQFRGPHVQQRWRVVPPTLVSQQCGENKAEVWVDQGMVRACWKQERWHQHKLFLPNTIPSIASQDVLFVSSNMHQLKSWHNSEETYSWSRGLKRVRENIFSCPVIPHCLYNMQQSHMLGKRKRLGW